MHSENQEIFIHVLSKKVRRLHFFRIHNPANQRHVSHLNENFNLLSFKKSRVKIISKEKVNWTQKILVIIQVAQKYFFNF
jgi:hypothetical protein